MQGGDSNEALRENARGTVIWQVGAMGAGVSRGALFNLHALSAALPFWARCRAQFAAKHMHPSAVALQGRHLHLNSGSSLQAALSRGLLPDDETLKQLILDPELPLTGRDISSFRWPEEPLRFVLTSTPRAQRVSCCNFHRARCIFDEFMQEH